MARVNSNPNATIAKTLYITRHANSPFAAPGHSDFNRPLSERGIRDAQAMAQRFAARGESVDLLISSTANRTLTTAGAFAEALGNPAIQRAAALYNADVHTLMTVIAELPDSSSRVLLFGHNPGVSDLVGHLLGEEPQHMVPCTTVRVDLPIERWAEAAQGIGTLGWRDQPPA